MRIDSGTKTLLDAIAYAEGHGKRLGYNTTYNFGKYTGGKVNLVAMTLDQVRKLQQQMLARQKGNRIRSTAVGRYQFIRKTFDRVRKAMNLPGSTKWTPAVQDAMAAFLLVERGLDKFRAGTMSRATFQNNLAKEWASIPTTAGKSAYGQGVGISLAELDWALDMAKERQPDDPGVDPPQPEQPAPIWRVFPWLLAGAVAVAAYFFFTR